MSHDDVKPSNWRGIAEQVSSEPDPDKVVNLANDLIRALDESSQRKLDHITPESKGPEKGVA